MAWLILIIAGLFEVAFVVGMKLSNGFKKVKFTISHQLFLQRLSFFCYHLL